MNNLHLEKSPYLLQHAENPVNWHAWNEAAFELAAREDKAIFLSIGYSTCHWCHVMAHQSFEDEHVADLMNQAFVNIKVDREERPDIDSLYMTVCSMMTGGGGWPLTIIMTPDKKPFFAGTYFPKDTQHGRIGMIDLVPAIVDVWQNKRDQIDSSVHSIIDNLQKQNTTKPGIEIDDKIIAKAYQELAERFDSMNGGFGTQPKFPSPHSLIFLLRYWKRSGDRQSLKMVEKTLTAMRLGGIYDHIGFGFHRYSTDAGWLLPHFEKMLYDQALLAMAYIEGYQATGNQLFRKTAEEVFTYVLRDMVDRSGGFYSAEDADSEGEEGKYYVWQMEELHQLLSSDTVSHLSQVFELHEEGNFKDESTGRKTGANIFHLSKQPSDRAGDLGLSVIDLQASLQQARTQLFEERCKRVPPHKDDKVLTDWNGLMIAALALGARILKVPAYLSAARQAAEFILKNMKTPDGRLLHRYRDGDFAIDGMLDDYAFLVFGLIELYETGYETRYLKEAITLNKKMIDLFWDEESWGFYLSPDNDNTILIRQKEIYDGAIPAGNSIALHNLLRLEKLTGDSDLGNYAKQLSRAFSNSIRDVPSAYTHFMSGMDLALASTCEVVIVGDDQAEDTQAMLDAVHNQYNPYLLTIFKNSNNSDGALAQIAPYTAEYTAIDDKSTAYICRNFSCEKPTNDLRKFIKILQG